MISTNDQFYDDEISIYFCFAFENLDAGAQEEIFPGRFRSDVAHALGINPKRTSIINIKDEDSLVVVKAVISDFYDDVSAMMMAQTIQSIGVKIFDENVYGKVILLNKPEEEKEIENEDSDFGDKGGDIANYFINFAVMFSNLIPNCVDTDLRCLICSNIAKKIEVNEDHVSIVNIKEGAAVVEANLIGFQNRDTARAVSERLGDFKLQVFDELFGPFRINAVVVESFCDSKDLTLEFKNLFQSLEFSVNLVVSFDNLTEMIIGGLHSLFCSNIARVIDIVEDRVSIIKIETGPTVVEVEVCFQAESAALAVAERISKLNMQILIDENFHPCELNEDTDESYSILFSVLFKDPCTVCNDQFAITVASILKVAPECVLIHKHNAGFIVDVEIIGFDDPEIVQTTAYSIFTSGVAACFSHLGQFLSLESGVGDNPSVRFINHVSAWAKYEADRIHATYRSTFDQLTMEAHNIAQAETKVAEKAAATRVRESADWLVKRSIAVDKLADQVLTLSKSEVIEIAEADSHTLREYGETLKATEAKEKRREGQLLNLEAYSDRAAIECRQLDYVMEGMKKSQETYGFLIEDLLSTKHAYEKNILAEAPPESQEVIRNMIATIWETDYRLQHQAKVENDFMSRLRNDIARKKAQFKRLRGGADQARKGRADATDHYTYKSAEILSLVERINKNSSAKLGVRHEATIDPSVHPVTFMPTDCTPENPLIPFGSVSFTFSTVFSDLTVDSFDDKLRQSFCSTVSECLGVERDRVSIVKIIAGSAIVEAKISGHLAENTLSSISKGNAITFNEHDFGKVVFIENDYLIFLAKLSEAAFTATEEGNHIDADEETAKGELSRVATANAKAESRSADDMASMRARESDEWLKLRKAETFRLIDYVTQLSAICARPSTVSSLPEADETRSISTASDSDSKSAFVEAELIIDVNFHSIQDYAENRRSHLLNQEKLEHERLKDEAVIDQLAIEIRRQHYILNGYQKCFEEWDTLRDFVFARKHVSEENALAEVPTRHQHDARDRISQILEVDTQKRFEKRKAHFEELERLTIDVHLKEVERAHLIERVRLMRNKREESRQRDLEEATQLSHAMEKRKSDANDVSAEFMLIFKGIVLGANVFKHTHVSRRRRIEHLKKVKTDLVKKSHSERTLMIREDVAGRKLRQRERIMARRNAEFATVEEKNESVIISGFDFREEGKGVDMKRLLGHFSEARRAKFLHEESLVFQLEDVLLESLLRKSANELYETESEINDEIKLLKDSDSSKRFNSMDSVIYEATDPNLEAGSHAFRGRQIGRKVGKVIAGKGGSVIIGVTGFGVGAALDWIGNSFTGGVRRSRSLENASDKRLPSENVQRRRPRPRPRNANRYTLS